MSTTPLIESSWRYIIPTTIDPWIYLLMRDLQGGRDNLGAACHCNPTWWYMVNHIVRKDQRKIFLACNSVLCQTTFALVKISLPTSWMRITMTWAAYVDHQKIYPCQAHLNERNKENTSRTAGNLFSIHDTSACCVLFIGHPMDSDFDNSRYSPKVNWEPTKTKNVDADISQYSIWHHKLM